ncbi:MAG TPA: hypothetical protein VG125_09280 [Pirellulales bacterium]|nr:hypothetical protein [Pirellulales bacterium]
MSLHRGSFGLLTCGWRIGVSPERLRAVAAREQFQTHAEDGTQPSGRGARGRNLNFSIRGWLPVLLVAGLASTGCTRTFWRGRADREVAYLVAEKSNNPRWALPPGFNLNMDPRSRYYDPTNPDHPPLPPDDPYSHVYMHRVDGKRAAPWWHINGELPQLPNPGWRQRLAEYCDMTPEGAIKLDMPGAVALSYIHSPAHRTQLETMYLSALDVSAERFRFNLQFYPGASLAFLRAGQAANGVTATPATPGHPAIVVPRSQLTETNGVAPGAPGGAVLSKEFATGGTLLVNFANSFVWQLAGPHTNATTSLINMNLVQPLLQNGGRVITLETLTLAERTLLGNLRVYERWRQAWFMNVATGNPVGPGTSTSRKGGGFGGTGITGFSGTGVGGLGNVASSSGFVGLGAGGGAGGLGGQATQAIAGAAGGGAGNLGGVYGILQQQINIDNAQNALNLQIRTLRLLEAYLAAGLINIAQVDLFRQSVETGKANLLNFRIGLETAKDSFKQATLGLPPDLPMVVDDPLMRQFRLIDPRLNDLQSKIAEFTERAGTLPANVSAEQLSGLYDVLSLLFAETGNALPRTREDLRVLESRTEARTRRMTPAERQEFINEKTKLNDSATELETRFTQMEVQLDDLRAKVGEQSVDETINSTVALANSLAGLVQEIGLVTASTRLESISIPPIELSTVGALQISRAHRLDWMNLRAAVVDQWRLICFNANSLRSVLNLTANGSLGTIGNNPAKFEANNGQLTLGVQFAPPLTRLLQRNNYRQALVQYQQQRRFAIQFEDTVNLALRNDMRLMTYFQINFEIQRQAVRIAVRRVDDTREELNQPPPPVVLGQPPASLGPTAASNLLTALTALSDSQNNLMSNWLQHYQQRMILYNDLGIMRLDERGLWIEEPIDQGLAQLEQMYPLPPELPVDWLKDAGLTPPALYPTEGVPYLGGSIPQVQAEAATPETSRPRMDLPRPEERDPSREIESLPTPGLEPPPAPSPEAMDGAAKNTIEKPKQKGWSWPFKKSGTAEKSKPAKTPAAVVAFTDSQDS